MDYRLLDPNHQPDRLTDYEAFMLREQGYTDNPLVLAVLILAGLLVALLALAAGALLAVALSETVGPVAAIALAWVALVALVWRWQR